MKMYRFISVSVANFSIILFQRYFRPLQFRIRSEDMFRAALVEPLGMIHGA